MHAGGGVTLNVSSLLKYIAECTEWDVELITAPKTGAPPLHLGSVDGLYVRILKTRKLPPPFQNVVDCWPIGFKTALRAELSRANVVHCHSLWRYPTRIGCPIMRRINKPYMIAPRGTLNPWALGYRGIRKRFAMWVHERKNLRAAACLHATSEAELTHIRRLGFSNPIALIPHGIREEALRAFENAIKKNGSSAKKKGKYRRLLCVSRLHPIKRIKELAQAWVSLASKYPNWELAIVGNGSPSYENDIRRVLAENATAKQRTILKGYLSGADLWDAYLGADLLVLPSQSENFGSVVVEALAAQLPVITTQGTPWSELEKAQCGWWIGMEQRQLEEALSQAMSLSDDQRTKMGHRGRSWVLEEFDWPRIAQKTVEVYDWILQGCRRDNAPQSMHFME